MATIVLLRLGGFIWPLVGVYANLLPIIDLGYEQHQAISFDVCSGTSWEPPIWTPAAANESFIYHQ